MTLMILPAEFSSFDYENESHMPDENGIVDVPFEARDAALRHGLTDYTPPAAEPEAGAAADAPKGKGKKKAAEPEAGA